MCNKVSSSRDSSVSGPSGRASQYLEYSSPSNYLQFKYDTKMHLLNKTPYHNSSDGAPYS